MDIGLDSKLDHVQSLLVSPEWIISVVRVLQVRVSCAGMCLGGGANSLYTETNTHDQARTQRTVKDGL